MLKYHNVARAAFFGSFAAGVPNDDSDLDIIVEFEGERSLLDLVALRLELEEIVGLEVDVVTYGSLHPRVKKAVLSEQVGIL